MRDKLRKIAREWSSTMVACVICVIAVCFMASIASASATTPEYNKSVKNGGTFTVQGIKYKVNGSALQVVKLTKAKKIYTIPDSVKVNGKNCKVSTVGSKIASGKVAKKVTSVKFGKNVAKIKKNAMKDCKKLMNVKFGVGLRTIEAGVFRGCKKGGTYTFAYSGDKKMKFGKKCLPKDAICRVPIQNKAKYDKLLDGKSENGSIMIVAYEPKKKDTNNTEPATEESKESDNTDAACQHNWVKEEYWEAITVEGRVNNGTLMYYVAPHRADLPDCPACDKWPEKPYWDINGYDASDEWVNNNTPYNVKTYADGDRYLFEGDRKLYIAIPRKNQLYVAQKWYYLSNGSVDTEKTFPGLSDGGTNSDVSILMGWKKMTDYRCSKCQEVKLANN